MATTPNLVTQLAEARAKVASLEGEATNPVVNDATIKTERAAALPYNGMACKILRKVELPDVAFLKDSPQTVVLIDGNELYFYESEVVPDTNADKPAVKTPPAV